MIHSPKKISKYLGRFTLWNGNLLVSKCSDLLCMMYLHLVSPWYGFVTSRFSFKIWVHHPRTFSTGETFSEIYFSYRFRIGINYLRISRFVFRYLMMRSVDIHVHPSFCSHGTTRLPIDGFSWNFIFEYFSKTYRENSSFVKIGQEYRVLCLKSNINFLTTYRWIGFRMRHVSDKGYRDNRNTFYVP